MAYLLAIVLLGNILLIVVGLVLLLLAGIEGLAVAAGWSRSGAARGDRFAFARRIGAWGGALLLPALALFGVLFLAGYYCFAGCG